MREVGTMARLKTQQASPAPIVPGLEKPAETDAMSIDTFCRRHGISRASFYNALAESRAPRVMRVGGRILISVEAAAEWRRAMEVAE